MRKLIAPAFVTLDGVMQAPGGPEEDTSSNFPYGGWVFPFWDDVLDKGTAENFGQPYDLLLGRKTYDIFAAYWPKVDVDPASPTYMPGAADIAVTFNKATKHVASRSKKELAWENSRWLGADAVAAVRELKKSDGPDLLTQGSSDFLQSLFAADLVDELRLIIFPITLGTGKKLFGSGTRAAAFKVRNTVTAPSGVIVANYERAGEVKQGSFEQVPEK